MVKNIIKEIIILLLMVLAIILVLGILLYDYVPNNKIIPDKVAYTTPENVSSELQTDIRSFSYLSNRCNRFKKLQKNKRLCCRKK